MELRVLVVDGHGDVLPERQIVGPTLMQQGEQVGDDCVVGKFNGVTIAVEEFLENTEVEHVDSHLGMVSTLLEKGLRRRDSIGDNICHLLLPWAALFKS